MTAGDFEQTDPQASVDDRQLEQARATILSVCRRCGLKAADAEDVAQDIFRWLLTARKLDEATCKPWLSQVSRNFVRRYWRRTLRDRKVGGGHTAADSSGGEPETRVFVRGLEALLEGRESLVVHEILAGADWIEATAAAHVPSGSRDWFRKRLAERVRGMMSFHERRSGETRAERSRPGLKPRGPPP